MKENITCILISHAEYKEANPLDTSSGNIFNTVGNASDFIINIKF